MKVPPTHNNYFDFEKWNLKYDPQPVAKDDPSKLKAATRLNRNQSQSTEVELINFPSQIGFDKSNSVLVKSSSTMHIPTQIK